MKTGAEGMAANSGSGSGATSFLANAGEDITGSGADLLAKASATAANFFAVFINSLKVGSFTLAVASGFGAT